MPKVEKYCFSADLAGQVFIKSHIDSEFKYFGLGAFWHGPFVIYLYWNPVP